MSEGESVTYNMPGLGVLTSPTVAGGGGRTDRVRRSISPRALSVERTTSQTLLEVSVELERRERACQRLAHAMGGGRLKGMDG